jgi:DNA-binding Lrp family transcriptional regulator
MSVLLEDLKTSLLKAIQEELPLVERPYAALGEKLGVSEGEVLATVAALKSSPRSVIRQISGIFDSQALGYRSTLVAADVDSQLVEQAAGVINGHPGVSHNYLRNHRYNLWYTLAVPPDSRFGLEGTVELLHRQSKARATRMLPTLRLFKIGVKLDVSGEADLTARSETTGFTQEARDQAAKDPLTPADKQMIRVLQQDLAVEERPFDRWARQAQVSTPELLAAAWRFKDQKRMRRFSAVLRHREAGFSANAMGVWAVPAGKEEEFGKAAATFAAVSHCYLRPTYEDWPYNVFTMVHAPTPERCQEVFAAIAEVTGVHNFGALYSTREFKKTRVKYFTGDTERWESDFARSQS